MRALAPLLAVLALAGCYSAAELGTDDGGGTGGLDAPVDTLDAGSGRRGVVVVDEDGESWICYVALCAGSVTQCGNCIDDDGDGRVDSRDRQCLGPCDNGESPALGGGAGDEPGEGCASDCYFDFGNGPGNDDCRWDHRCDPLAVEPSFDPEGPMCAYDPGRVGGRECPEAQSERCQDVCRPLTPSGCDCFGCCTFDAIADRPQAEGGTHVWLGSVTNGTNVATCSLDVVEDRTLCRPCTPVLDCYNPCGSCELCIGRSALPPGCSAPRDGGTSMRCEGGEQPCGLRGDPECPFDYYCISGCCQPTLI